jgi:hypothetical protein
VASKKTNSGETPVSRTALAFNVSEPLVLEHAKPLGAATGVLIATVVDCCVVPLAPVQLSV